MIFLIVWLLCGLGAAYIADSKGRSGCGFFALGVLLGPLGLLLAALVGTDPSRQNAPRTGVVDPMKKCPECAETIKAEAIKCRYCGAIFAPEPVEPETVEPTLGSTHCARCGKDLEASEVRVLGVAVVCADCFAQAKRPTA